MLLSRIQGVHTNSWQLAGNHAAFIYHERPESPPKLHRCMQAEYRIPNPRPGMVVMRSLSIAPGLMPPPTPSTPRGAR